MDTRVHIIGNRNSYLNHILYELRSVDVQTDRLRFRTNLERVGEILAYEISRRLAYTDQKVITPLGEMEIPLLGQQPVLVSILRAGIPLHQGFLRMFDKADSGFVGAFRKTTRNNEFVVKVEYQAQPDINGRDVILLDPMIATGRSIVLVAQSMLANGIRPQNLFIAGVVACDEGVEYVLRNVPSAQVFVAAMDHELTAKSYI
ncbi:MAG: uracil phosphoribosyltransferase, partial [Bacteroidota bacterium]